MQNHNASSGFPPASGKSAPEPASPAGPAPDCGAPPRPALVTGSGLVSCLGLNLRDTLDALNAGQRVKGAPLDFLAGTAYAHCLAASLPEADLSGRVADRRMRKFMSAQSVLAAVAARQALAQSAPLERGIAPERIGLYAGVGLAAVDVSASAELLRKSLDRDGRFCMDGFSRSGLPTIHPLWSFHTLANMPGCIVSVLEGLKGDNGIYTPWEDQSAAALLEAAHALDQGLVDCAVAVAADTPDHPASLAELHASGFIRGKETASPGAACLVLERPGAQAQKRAANGCSGPGSGFVLSGMRLEQSESGPDDPLAPYLGRTIAAAPLILVLLAGALGLPRAVTGCGGQRFSFEVSACAG